jgi:hypothetical protein
VIFKERKKRGWYWDGFRDALVVGHPDPTKLAGAIGCWQGWCPENRDWWTR